MKFREKYKHQNSLTIHSPGNEDEELALRFSCREIPSEASLKMQQEQFNEIKKQTAGDRESNNCMEFFH